jgi:hypothetical protein
MGFGHASDFEMVLPVIVQFMRRNPKVVFELFGTIPKPVALNEFGRRITMIPPVRDYEDFLAKLSELRWSVGICPLRKNDFNLVKADTKWVEYTSVGAAVIASKGTVYDDCCSDGCGILAETDEDWLAALEKLITDRESRLEQTGRAQKKLQEKYSIDSLLDQVLDVFKQARSNTLRRERVCIIANDFVPTLQLSFIKPLSSLVETSGVTIEILTNAQLKEISRLDSSVGLTPEQWIAMTKAWFIDNLTLIKPTILVFCRYSDKLAHANLVIEWARREGIPTVYHIDDNLLGVPRELGEEKYHFHNNPRRTGVVRYLLENVDIVYCSTKRLKNKLQSLGIKNLLVAGDIYCPGQIIVPVENRAVKKIGYMASSDHSHNFKIALPALSYCAAIRNSGLSFSALLLCRPILKNSMTGFQYHPR